LGADGGGIVEPVAAGRTADGTKPGVGMEPQEDDAFAMYKKRMSKAYTYRNAVLNSGPQNNFMPGTVPPPREKPKRQ